MSEKLQKVLARAGVGSRREMEDWIAAGRVSINGSIAKLGERVEGDEVIRVDGHILSSRRMAAPRRRVLVYNKPERQMCTHSDPEGRPTVFDRLPNSAGARWLSIGRLDFNTMGLLLLTTDGELAHRMSHPSFGMEREYAVRVLGEMPKDAINQLLAGVQLDDGPAQFQRVINHGGEGANHWYHVTLGEGRNREVRRMFEAVGGTVSRLIRVRYGPVELPRGLQRGRWEEMDVQQVRNLSQTLKLPAEQDSGRAGARGRPSGGGRPSSSQQRGGGRRDGRGSRDGRGGGGSGSGAGSRTDSRSGSGRRGPPSGRGPR